MDIANDIPIALVRKEIEQLLEIADGLKDSDKVRVPGYVKTERDHLVVNATDLGRCARRNAFQKYNLPMPVRLPEWLDDWEKKIGMKMAGAVGQWFQEECISAAKHIGWDVSAEARFDDEIRHTTGKADLLFPNYVLEIKTRQSANPSLKYADVLQGLLYQRAFNVPVFWLVLTTSYNPKTDNRMYLYEARPFGDGFMIRDEERPISDAWMNPQRFTWEAIDKIIAYQLEQQAMYVDAPEKEPEEAFPFSPENMYERGMSQCSFKFDSQYPPSNGKSANALCTCPLGCTSIWGNNNKIAVKNEGGQYVQPQEKGSDEWF